MSRKINKQIFLDELPRLNGTNKIDWKNCIGRTINFVYGDINDSFKIVAHNIKEQKVKIEYKDNLYDISPYSINNCKLGQLFKTRNYTYIYDIGDNIIDDNRNLTITGRYKNENGVRCYNYTCNICGWDDGDIIEYEMKKGVKCSCCANMTTVPGINDIPTTAPWMIDYFQGGKEEASHYTKCSNKKIFPICPDCKTIHNKEFKVNEIYQQHGFSCPNCSDGYSYPEKFFYSVLKQLGIDFIVQLSRKHVTWARMYRYDFCIPDIKCIIEVHGKQHYEETKINYIGRSLRDEINNDEKKKELALLNGYMYFSIDCRKSEKSWIRESIINSGILDLLNRNPDEINWKKCDEFATSNRCKEICKIKSNNPKLTATDISVMTQLSLPTICSYLHKGEKFGWCNYSSNGKKRVKMIKNGIEIGIFESAKDITKLEQYKNFSEFMIQRVCRGTDDSYNGYLFMYI